MNTYKSTRHSKYLLNYHFVWIPKYRRKILDNPEIKQIIKETIVELGNKHLFVLLNLSIQPGHIHAFISSRPKNAPSWIINIIKSVTGHRIAKKYPHLKKKGSIWTRAYFVSSAGNVSSETIQQYIQEQEKNSRGVIASARSARKASRRKASG